MEKDLVHQVGEILHGYNMLVPGMRLGVAVSGGADSVTLLHILHSLSQSLDFRLTILHLNHQLRGAASDQDEEFVRHLASSLSIPIVCRAEPITPGNLEQEARRARQLFFQGWRAQFESARVALGHTRSDQCETVLFRFLRGSGLTGLTGMSPLTRSGLIRPLLFTSRAQVRDYATKAGWNWSEDTSNQDVRFRRNRLRLVTLPQLVSDHNPALEEVLSRTAELAGAEESFWERRTRKLYASLVRTTHFGLTILVDKFNQLHVAEQRRLLRFCLFTIRKSLRRIDSFHINAILRICQSDSGHDRVIVPGIDAIRSFQTLLLADPAMMQQPRGYLLDVTISEEVILPYQLGKLIVNPANTDVQNCVKFKDTGLFVPDEGDLDRGFVESVSAGGAIQIRNWEPGDTLQRPGSSRPEKIKTFFQESRVVLWERRHWPVLVAGGRIVWARKFGVDVRFRPHAAKDLLQVRFFPAL